MWLACFVKLNLRNDTPPDLEPIELIQICYFVKFVQFFHSFRANDTLHGPQAVTAKTLLNLREKALPPVITS